MTETEFIKRLQHELLTNPAWEDVDAALTRANNLSLAGNELLVFPISNQDNAPILRIVVEPLTESEIEP